MEKSGSWREIPSSFLHGGRSSRALRVATFGTLILFLVLIYGGSSSTTTTTTTTAADTAAAGGISGHHKPPAEPAATGGARGRVPRPSRAQQRLMDAAGNATLGFGSIQFINLPGRFDRLDAATLQAWLSGIEITETRGVLAAEINDVGMPPEHMMVSLKTEEKGCWRAHANIWSQMLRDKTPAVLILESDAAWDVEVRESMRLLNQHFSRLLDIVRSTPLPNRSFLNRPSASATPRSAAAAAAAPPPPPPAAPAHPPGPRQSTPR
ncbi:hypothetical protein MY3296_001159, partial [Beauveria thailandica]